MSLETKGQEVATRLKYVCKDADGNVVRESSLPDPRDELISRLNEAAERLGTGVTWEKVDD
tara:strand:- start:688 stop:870 length:183 start_codon:yes stop_codon:yes gene_type:complete